MINLKTAFPFIRNFYPTDFVRTAFFFRITNWDQIFLMLVFPFVGISARINNRTDISDFLHFSARKLREIITRMATIHSKVLYSKYLF